jgi:hypothetical protein
MAPVKRLVVDVLKPHAPDLLEFTEQLAAVESVDGVTTSLIELDKEVQNVKLTFEGEALVFPDIEDRVDALGGTIHSVDQVACGAYIVEDRHTLQDP